jgi:GT2 family glycosyltransferase
MKGKRKPDLLKTKEKQVYVVVLNWNKPELTIDCIQSVLRSKGVNFHVVAIDNGSTDESPKILRKYLMSLNKGTPSKTKKTKFHYEFRGETTTGSIETINGRILLSCGKNYGFTGGCNVGIRYSLLAGATHVFLLNNDAKVRPETLRTLLGVSLKNNTAIIGAQVLNAVPDTAGHPSFETEGETTLRKGHWPLSIFLTAGLCHYVFKWGKRLWPAQSPPEIWESDWVGGCGIMIGRDLLESRWEKDSFYLDPAFFMYWEETDLCLYAWKNGFRVVFSRDAVVEHYPPHRIVRGENPRQSYYFNRNSLLFSRKWLSNPAFFLFATYHFISLVLLHFLRILKKGPRAFFLTRIELSGFFDGLRNVAGKWAKHDAPAKGAIAR